MKYIIILPFFLFTAVSFGEREIDLSVGTAYESNPLYVDKTDIGDSLVFFNSYLRYLTAPSNFQFEYVLDADYKKYAQLSEADNLEYETKVLFPILKKRKFNFTIYSGLEHRSDPPDAFDEKIGERNKLSAGVDFDWALSSKYSMDLDFKYSSESFKFSSFKYLENQRIRGRYQFNYNFLPETKLYGAVAGGTDVYPYGDINDSNTSQRKDNSVSMIAEMGIEGRLTEYSRMTASFGYEQRVHEDSENFSEPVFKLSFEEQVSPQDIILAGYDYVVADSYYTAWKLEQAIYLGYSKIIGDQYLFSTRLSYVYRSFSNPNRREDQRLRGIFSLEYSYKPTYLIVGEILGDFLFSDSYNQSSGDVFDRAAAYEFISLAVSIKKSF